MPASRVPRVCVLVCDSWGVGDAPDADAYGDAGAVMTSDPYRYMMKVNQKI